MPVIKQKYMQFGNTSLSVSMVVHLLRLRCGLSTTIQPDAPPTFKAPKHQIQS